MLQKYFLLFFFLITSISIFGQNDSIKLINNNSIVGEIKSMDQSVLVFKTPYSKSDFKIKWNKVSEIYSDRIFILSLSGGERLKSTINTSSEDKTKVMLYHGEQTFNTDIKNVVFLDAIGTSFFSKMSASFDVGITLTKANNLKQFTANSALGYVSNKWSSTGNFSLVKSRQDDVDDVKRISGNLGAQWFLPKDWFLQSSADFLSNSEQLLKLRTTTRVGMGYFFKRNNSLYFGAAAGLAFNNESYTSDNEGKNSVEMYISAELNKYAIGDLSMVTSISLYPSLTESGRVRSDFNFDMKYDLPYDFYIKTTVTYNYDNQPADGAAQSDYVFQTSFGWELKM